MKRPVWLFSMDSEQFNAPPTTTAALTACFRRYGHSASDTHIELVHFQTPEDIAPWLSAFTDESLTTARAAERQPVFGFSCYTWNMAEFIALARELKALLPQALNLAGGPHVQQAEDYLGVEPFDVIVLGEGETTFQELLDADSAKDWRDIPGLAFLDGDQLVTTAPRERRNDLDYYPSPLDALELTDPQGQPRYEAIAYETSRGCPFRCAFCEWGTGDIGGKMRQWSMERIHSDWRRIAAAGIQDIWLADSNFGALKQDLQKAQLITDLKQDCGFPRSFATSWSKKHSRQVQEIALLLHRHQLLPHYQLALQTLTPEALRLSNRQNMSANQYEPIARQMSAEGVPIAAELIWGLPGDNLPDFERNLDQLLATFPNINIFGYTLLPGTEFFERRQEYRIEAIPVAGYGKAKGEYVVGCHSFDREQGEEGYFLISAHILFVHGHILPLTLRYLALEGSVPVSPLLRTLLRSLLQAFPLESLDPRDRMQVYEDRNRLYLAALADPARLFKVAHSAILEHLLKHSGADLVDPVEKLLALDQVLCPRVGGETTEQCRLGFDAVVIEQALAAMNLPGSEAFAEYGVLQQVHHPGGVGEILLDADGGSWLKGAITAAPPEAISVAQLAEPLG